MLLLALPLDAWPASLAVRSLDDPPRVQLVRGEEVVLELEEADEAAARRAASLAMRTGPAFRVTTREDRAQLWAGPELLGEFTQDQARRWGTTPYSLARTFAARLEAARTGKVPPEPSLEPASLVVPLGETRSARWRNLAGSPEVTVSDPNPAGVEVAGGEVRVTGVGRGNTVVTLAWPDRTLRLPVQVRPRAARLPSRLEIAVSGTLPLEEALRRVLLGKAAPHPAARLELAFEKPPTLGAEVPVRVSASGTGLLPARGRVQVRFTPAKVGLQQAGALAMSNRPEKVTGEGVLLRELLPAAPVRVLVHHRNVPEGPERYLEVLLRNPTAAPLRVFTILSCVGPSSDEIFAGHLATRRFLERLQALSGLVLRLAPGETMLVERLRLKPGQTVSGMGWLQPVEGGGAELVVRAVDAEGGAVDRDLAEPGPGSFPTGRGLFPPEIQRTHAHQIGSRYTFIPLGDLPFLTDPGTGEANPGNFGVVHRLRVVLTNPTAEPREARLDFHPRGGPARGLFFVDDTFVETGLASHGSPFRLGRWTLAPGEQREVLLETLPQSGSNYPVNLDVSSDFLNLPAPPEPTGAPLAPRWLP